jgi:hypothetical protein
VSPHEVADLLNDRAAANGTLSRDEVLEVLGVTGEVLDHLALTGGGPQRIDRWHPPVWRACEVRAYVARLADRACR